MFKSGHKFGFEGGGGGVGGGLWVGVEAMWRDGILKGKY